MDEDISGIPTKTIVDTAEEFEIKAKRSRTNKVKAANLEVLIVMKFNGRRNQDIDDLETLVSSSHRQVNWDYLKRSLLNDDDFQYNRIR
jgi:predicted nucleotidyltransferase